MAVLLLLRRNYDDGYYVCYYYYSYYVCYYYYYHHYHTTTQEGAVLLLLLLLPLHVPLPLLCYYYYYYYYYYSYYYYYDCYYSRHALSRRPSPAPARRCARPSCTRRRSLALRSAPSTDRHDGRRAGAPGSCSQARQTSRTSRALPHSTCRARVQASARNIRQARCGGRREKRGKRGRVSGSSVARACAGHTSESGASKARGAENRVEADSEGSALTTGTM